MSAIRSDQSPEAAVRTALAAVAATRSLADAALEPLHGGLSNHAWRAEQGGCSWFVRLGGPESATLGVDRESERTLLVAAAAAGLAPPLVACDPSNGLLVTRFIAGGPWQREDAHELRNIARIAERIRVLHAIEPAAAVRRLDFAAQARNLEAQLRVVALRPAPEPAGSDSTSDTAGLADAPGEAMRRATGAAFDLLASRQPRLVPCHNDLHHLNLLDDGTRLWIVDWEYGGVGDPAFDLASFACQHELGAAGRNALLAAYGASAEIPASTLDAACTVFDYVQWLWYMLWAARNPDSAEYASRARALAQRLSGPGP